MGALRGLTVLTPLIGDTDWPLLIGEIGLCISLIGDGVCHPPDLPLGVGDLGAIGDLGGDINAEFLGTATGESDGECIFFGGDFDLSMLHFWGSLFPLSSLLLPAISA